MPNLTVSVNIDSLLQSADYAAARTNLGLSTLATTTPGTGVATALAVNTGTAGAFVVNGGALGTPSSGTVTNLTGTASININGTVGATTATTGAFTTVSATGAISAGVGGSTAGAMVLTQGTTQSTGTTNITLQAPTSVTSYIRTLPGAVGSTGFLLETVSGSVQTESLVAGTGSGNVMRDTNPTLAAGALTLAENASIALDPAGSADGKYSGITVTGTAGYTQAFGDCVYLDPTDSRWEACDANSAAGADGDSRGIVGMVVSAGTDGTACTILLRGIIRADAKFPTFTVNNPIYISETAGSVTQTQPTTTDVVIRIVGAALTADEMYFGPDNLWFTHT